MPTDDDQLVQRAAAGDGDALSKLLERYGREVGRGIEADIGPQWRPMLDADDIMQVTYLEAFLEADSLVAGDVRTFVAWLGRIARNNLRDAIRGLVSAKRPNPRRRIESLASDRSYVELVSVLTGRGPSPSRDVAADEARALLESALNRLPEDYAKVVRMLDLEGRTGDETAEQMGRSRGAVYLMRVRAFERLRDLLGSGSRFFTDAG